MQACKTTVYIQIQQVFGDGSGKDCCKNGLSGLEFALLGWWRDDTENSRQSQT